MMHDYRILVPGEPVPKARARAGKGGRFYTPKETEEYEKRVRLVALAAKPSGWPMRCRYRIDVTVCRSDRGDLDNYIKAALDAVNPRKAKGGKRPRVAVPGVLWIDDSRVHELAARIVNVLPGEARLELRVTALPVRCERKTCGGRETFYPDDQGRCEDCAARMTTKATRRTPQRRRNAA